MEQSDVEKKFKDYIETSQYIQVYMPVSNVRNAQYGYQYVINTNSVFGTNPKVYYGQMVVEDVTKWNIGETTITYNQDGDYLTYTISYDGPAEVLEYHVEYNGETFESESDTITLVDDSLVTAYIVLQGNDLTNNIQIDLQSYTPEIVVPELDYNTVFGIDAGSSSWHTLGWELYIFDDDGSDYYFDPDKWDATLTITNSDGESYELTNALESDGSIFGYDNYRYNIYLPLKEFTKCDSTYTFTLVCTLKIDTTKSITLSDSYGLTYDTIVQGIPDRNISYDGPNYNDDNTQCSVNVYGDMYLYNIYGDWKIKLRDNLDNEIDIDYETVDDEHGSNYVNCDFNEEFNYDYSDNGYIECHLILVDPNGVEYDMADTNYTIECSEPEDDSSSDDSSSDDSSSDDSSSDDSSSDA